MLPIIGGTNVLILQTKNYGMAFLEEQPFFYKDYFQGKTRADKNDLIHQFMPQTISETISIPEMMFK